MSFSVRIWQVVSSKQQTPICAMHRVASRMPSNCCPKYWIGLHGVPRVSPVAQHELACGGLPSGPRADPVDAGGQLDPPGSQAASYPTGEIEYRRVDAVRLQAQGDPGLRREGIRHRAPERQGETFARDHAAGGVVYPHGALDGPLRQVGGTLPSRLNEGTSHPEEVKLPPR